MLKRNLFFLFSLLTVGLASFIISINNYNPYEASLPILLFFYTSFFVTVLSLLSIAIFYFKVGRSKSEVIFKSFWPSVRQGVFISFALTALLALKGLRLFDVWVAIPVIVIIILLELFFQTKK